MYNIILGSAYGDALGAPFEIFKKTNERLLSWNGEFADFTDHKFHVNFKKGDTTDDYAMTEVVAKSLIKNKDYNPEDISKDYIDWFFGPNSKGTGKTTQTAITNLKNGISYKESGVLGSWGNGTAMRAAPFGAFFKDKKKIIEVCTIDAKITHNSEEAVAGSIAIALMVYSILNNVEFLISDVPGSFIQNKLDLIPELLKLSMEEGLMHLGTSFDIRHTVPAVIYSFYKDPTINGMINLIKAGGDTDTNASILGCLLGANKLDFPENQKEITNYSSVISLNEEFNKYI